jgi:hypothetical protein
MSFWNRATRSAMVSTLALAAAAASTAGAGPHTRVVVGDRHEVDGQWVSTWARLDSRGSIVSVGFTLPYGLAASPPAKRGDGPAGSVAVLPFPKTVQEQTYFNHFELHWNPKGHPPACYMIPHYDFHFYGVPVAFVEKVGLADTAAPDADHLAAGYVYPGKDRCIPQMGVHASTPMDMSPGHPFRATMVAGYYGGNMTFVEPMVTRTCLLSKRSFTLPVPEPPVLGRATLYPHAFATTYDAGARVYRFTFSDFEKTK